MKRMMMAVAGAVLAVGMGVANTKPLHQKPQHPSGYTERGGPMVQRNVGLGLDPTQNVPRTSGLGLDPAAPRANADLKYGPQPDYPQSPPGGGY